MYGIFINIDQRQLYLEPEFSSPLRLSGCLPPLFLLGLGGDTHGYPESCPWRGFHGRSSPGLVGHL